jgi:hypothetical protein
VISDGMLRLVSDTGTVLIDDEANAAVAPAPAGCAVVLDVIRKSRLWSIRPIGRLRLRDELNTQADRLGPPSVRAQDAPKRAAGGRG